MVEPNMKASISLLLCFVFLFHCQPALAQIEESSLDISSSSSTPELPSTTSSAEQDLFSSSSSTPTPETTSSNVQSTYSSTTLVLPQETQSTSTEFLESSSSSTPAPAEGASSSTTPAPAEGASSSTPAPAEGASSSTTLVLPQETQSTSTEFLESSSSSTPAPAEEASSSTTPAPAEGASSSTTPAPAEGASSSTTPAPAEEASSSTTPAPAEETSTWKASEGAVTSSPTAETSPMLTTPTSAEVCGDGVVEGGEECDDGNTRSRDGCDVTCLVETPFWNCSVAEVPSKCELIKTPAFQLLLLFSSIQYVTAKNSITVNLQANFRFLLGARITLSGFENFHASAPSLQISGESISSEGAWNDVSKEVTVEVTKEVPNNSSLFFSFLLENPSSQQNSTAISVSCSNCVQEVANFSVSQHNMAYMPAIVALPVTICPPRMFGDSCEFFCWGLVVSRSCVCSEGFFGFDCNQSATFDASSSPPPRLLLANTGGAVRSSVGVGVEIPPLALSSDQTISVKVFQLDRPLDLGIQASTLDPAGPVLDFGPPGLKFARPVRIFLPFDPSRVPAGHEVHVYYKDETKFPPWVRMDGGRVPGSNLTYADTLHFSTYMSISSAPSPPPTNVSSTPAPPAVFPLSKLDRDNLRVLAEIATSASSFASSSSQYLHALSVVCELNLQDITLSPHVEQKTSSIVITVLLRADDPAFVKRVLTVSSYNQELKTVNASLPPVLALLVEDIVDDNHLGLILGTTIAGGLAFTCLCSLAAFMMTRGRVVNSVGAQEEAPASPHSLLRKMSSKTSTFASLVIPLNMTPTGDDHFPRSPPFLRVEDLDDEMLPGAMEESSPPPPAHGSLGFAYIEQASSMGTDDRDSKTPPESVA